MGGSMKNLDNSNTVEMRRIHVKNLMKNQQDLVECKTTLSSPAAKSKTDKAKKNQKIISSLICIKYAISADLNSD